MGGKLLKGAEQLLATTFSLIVENHRFSLGSADRFGLVCKYLYTGSLLAFVTDVFSFQFQVLL